MHKKLGRGLADMFKDKMINLTNNIKFCELNIEDIISNNLYPRKLIDSNSLTELSESIKKYGILNPILVIEQTNYNADDNFIKNDIHDEVTFNTKQYELVSGSRRLKAAKLISMQKIPAIIINKDKKEQLLINLIENLQIQKLNAIEQAESYIKLIEDHDISCEELSILLCKNLNYIKDLISLNNLTSEAKQALIDDKIDINHAKYLASFANQTEIINYIIEKQLTQEEVGDLLKIIKNYILQNKLKNVDYSLKNILKENAKLNKQKNKDNLEDINSKEVKPSNHQVELNQIADMLSENINAKVTLNSDGKGYMLNIKLHNLAKLDELLEKICK